MTTSPADFHGKGMFGKGMKLYSFAVHSPAFQNSNSENIKNMKPNQIKTTQRGHSRRIQYGTLTAGGVLEMFPTKPAALAATGRGRVAVKCLASGWIETLDGKATGRAWK